MDQVNRFTGPAIAGATNPPTPKAQINFEVISCQLAAGNDRLSDIVSRVREIRFTLYGGAHSSPETKSPGNDIPGGILPFFNYHTDLLHKFLNQLNEEISRIEATK